MLIDGGRLTITRGLGAEHAFVVIVNRHAKDLFRVSLTDHMLVKRSQKICWTWHDQSRLCIDILLGFFIQDRLADLDAVVADINAGAGDQLLHFRMALATEGTDGEIRSTGHGYFRRLRRKCRMERAEGASLL